MLPLPLPLPLLVFCENEQENLFTHTHAQAEDSKSILSFQEREVGEGRAGRKSIITARERREKPRERNEIESVQI